MSFVGKLDQFKLPDLIQIIATTAKTGKLSLTRRDSQGVIVFRGGKIIYAASSSARETLGSLLLCHNLIDEDSLVRALEIQHQATEEKRLGTILVEMGALAEASLREVITRQIEEIVSEFMQWDSGFFKFDLLHLPDQGEIEVDAEDFVHREGLSAQRVLLDITTRLDELERGEDGSDAAPPPAEAPAPPAEGLESLRSIMTEIRSPQFTGEATHRILSFARGRMARGVLFVVRREHFYGMGQFGVDPPGGSGDEVVRALKLPLGKPSAMSEAADRKGTFCGPLAETSINRRLVDALGGAWPEQVVTVPLVVNDTVLLVFYGDSGGGGGEIDDVEQLELLMNQAGLAMERNLLQKRLEVLETRRRR